ncbi:hypothetical protein GCM10009675_32270 [Prauserella alba]|uniref:Uncharacterized protein n=1 Tax=Prauserella alba TaxID=176898 RepID=A0ABP4G184_9PSEU
MLEHEGSSDSDRVAGKVRMRTEEHRDSGAVARPVLFDSSPSLKYPEDPLGRGHMEASATRDVAQP